LPEFPLSRESIAKSRDLRRRSRIWHEEQEVNRRAKEEASNQ